MPPNRSPNTLCSPLSQVLDEDRAPLLFSIVFGEGVVNDATTVALLRAVAALGRAPTLSAGVGARLLASFAALFAASLALGVAGGLAGSLLLKRCPPKAGPGATGVVCAAAYLAYAAADAAGLSGIVSLFSAAVALAHYGLPSLPRPQRAAARAAAGTLSGLCEGAIFVYVGLDALDPRTWARAKPGAAVGLACLVLTVTLAARAAFVFAVLAAPRVGGGPGAARAPTLSLAHAAVAWWAGGARGAVSVALAYSYYRPGAGAGAGAERPATDERTATLVAATLLVVLASTLGFGAATKPVMERLLGPAAAGTPRPSAGGGGGGASLELAPILPPAPPALAAKPPSTPGARRGSESAELRLAASWGGDGGCGPPRPRPPPRSAADALTDAEAQHGEATPWRPPGASSWAPPAAGGATRPPPPRAPARPAAAGFGGWWADFDERVMRPVFTGRVTMEPGEGGGGVPPLATARSDAPTVVALAGGGDRAPPPPPGRRRTRDESGV